MAYTPSDSSARMLHATGSTLKRMSDSELTHVAKKLQQYFSLRCSQSDHRRFYSYFSGYYSIAQYGSVIMTTLNRGVVTEIQSYRVDDFRMNATNSSKSNNSFDNFGDDDDSFGDPSGLSTQHINSFYLAQRHFANYSNTQPGNNGYTALSANGDKYSELRNFNASTTHSGTITGMWNGHQPGDWIKEWGHLTSDGNDIVRIEGDSARIAEAIFKEVNRKIRSTDSDSWGQYRIATSAPSTSHRLVREVPGYNQSYYWAFRDTLSNVDGSDHYNNLDSHDATTYYLYLNRPAYHQYENSGTEGSGVARPTRLSKWKITVVSGFALDGKSDGSVGEFYAMGTYNVQGKYFYFKPSNSGASGIYVSSDYSSATPSATSFESSARSVGFPQQIGTSLTATRFETLYPSGNSADGYCSIYMDDRFRSTSQYNTSTVYKAERVDRIIQYDLPYIGYFDDTYDGTSYLGHPDFNGNAATMGRNENLMKMYVPYVLYKLYTLGRYYPVYKIAQSVGSGEYNHGAFASRIKTGSTVYGPTITGSSNAESGTYYKVRGASGNISTTNYYLVSTVDI